MDRRFGWRGLVGFGVLLIEVSAALLLPTFWSGIGKIMYCVHIFLSDHDDSSRKKMLTEKIACVEGTTADGWEASPHDANDECENDIET